MRVRLASFTGSGVRRLSKPHLRTTAMTCPDENQVSCPRNSRTMKSMAFGITQTVYVGLGLSSLAGATFALLAERANITVFQDTWLHSDLIGGKNVFLLKAGSNVPIAKCNDIKSYVVYQLLLPNGKMAYLDSGYGKVEVRSIFSRPFDQPVVWNCF